MVKLGTTTIEPWLGNLVWLSYSVICLSYVFRKRRLLMRPISVHSFQRNALSVITPALQKAM